MSRFRPRSSAPGAVLSTARPTPLVQAVPPPQFNRPLQTPGFRVTSPEPRGSTMQRFGFLVLCGYLVSGVLNEWAIRLVGIKGYLSVITLVSLPVVWLVSGSAFRGLRHSIGWLWAGFLCWLLLATPFSIWRGGSVQLLTNYVPRSYVLLFYVTALAVSLRNCRQLMYLNVATAFMTLLTCIAFGTHGEDGRYRVPGGAGFFDNSNELAMQLLMGITQFVYLFSQKNRVAKVAATLGIAVSMPYMLWTGSRGCMLGAIAYGILLLYMSRNRVRVLAVMVIMAAIGLMIAPSAVLHRLTLLTGDEAATSASDQSAIQSQMSRIELLKRSVSETISHPLFGVGPGQFPVAVMDAAKAKGEWFQWLGTHNSYTQVSSECGIPAFILYVATIVGCFSVNFRLWKAFRNRAEGADIALLSAALLSGSLVFAVCAFFFHMAYGGVLPLLGGQTVALYFVARQQFKFNRV
jgi:O-antigen ligase/polysaccharide polymerase Wzy-like membrane protein